MNTNFILESASWSSTSVACFNSFASSKRGDIIGGVPFQSEHLEMIADACDEDVLAVLRETKRGNIPYSELHVVKRSIE